MSNLVGILSMSWHPVHVMLSRYRKSAENSQEEYDIGCVQNLLTSRKDLGTYLKRGYASMLKLTVIQECVTKWNTKLSVL